MSVRHCVSWTGCSALLALILFAPAGCKRRPPATDQAPPAASQPGLHLHDWVLEPVVDEAEQHLPALRIVSAAPNVTEICCALGLRAALVGRTRYCDYPPEIKNVPSIGALIDVDVERLLALQPDVILVSGSSRMQVERFAAFDLRFESVADATLSDLFAAVRQVGALTGRARTAERLCDGIEADLATVTTRFSAVPSARVLLLTGTLSDPPRAPYVAGPGSFYDDLLKLEGHENVLADRQAAFGPLSLEFIGRANPDVIIELDPNGKSRPGGDADALPVWEKVGGLRAAAVRRIHVLTGSQHYLLGPRIAFTYDALCRAIADNDHE